MSDPHYFENQTNDIMKIGEDNEKLNKEEMKDICRGLIIAMQALDLTKNPPDLQLSDRLEKIEKKLNKHT